MPENLLKQPGSLEANGRVAGVEQFQQGGNRRLRQPIEQGLRGGQSSRFLLVVQEMFQFVYGRGPGGQFQGGNRRRANCRLAAVDRLPQPLRVARADTCPKGPAGRRAKRIGHGGQEFQEQGRRLRRGRVLQPLQRRHQQLLARLVRLALLAIGQETAGAMEHFQVVALQRFAECRLGNCPQQGQLPGSGLATPVAVAAQLADKPGNPRGCQRWAATAEEHPGLPRRWVRSRTEPGSSPRNPIPAAKLRRDTDLPQETRR